MCNCNRRSFLTGGLAVAATAATASPLVAAASTQEDQGETRIINHSYADCHVKFTGNQLFATTVQPGHQMSLYTNERKWMASDPHSFHHKFCGCVRLKPVVHATAYTAFNDPRPGTVKIIYVGNNGTYFFYNEEERVGKEYIQDNVNNRVIPIR